MRWLAALASGVVLALVLWDAFETVVVPRRVNRRLRLTRLFYRATWEPFAAGARRIRSVKRRESVLSVYGPLSLLLLLAVWAMGLIMGFGLLLYALGSPVGMSGTSPGLALDLYFSGTTFFTLGLGDATPLHYLLAAFEDSRRAETEALRFQILSREAELRALRAQIHPHFLFNSLNSINALIGSRPQEARKVCVLLADFLRRSLALGARERVPFAEELALAEDLLAIEKVRFGTRLHFAPRVKEAALSCLVPPLLLQPLVENAVTHGIAQCLGGAVRLDARCRGERLLVAIENPRDGAAPPRKGNGIGIENVRRRLETLYGRDAELRLHPDGDSFQVELELPAAASS